jgi:hypothetical protein
MLRIAATCVDTYCHACRAQLCNALHFYCCHLAAAFASLRAVPWKSFVTDKNLWAIAGAHMAHNWGLYVMVSLQCCVLLTASIKILIVARLALLCSLHCSVCMFLYMCSPELL